MRSILMFAEMTPGSNSSGLISWKGFDKSLHYEQQNPKPEKSFSDSKLKDHTHPKSPSFKSCLKFCFKDRVKMEQREPQKDSHASLTEGKLKELASKWFIETQVPHIIHNGFFPSWFLGFITRKDAEEILKEKELGCFLVRLSDKAMGYILSYKGRDRCRHFVISQSENGQFVVCGDSEGHNTVPDLIDYYKTRPIEPFGEFLTSSCFGVINEDLYDTIQISPNEKPAAAVQKPTRPPKSNRTQEEVPPLPQRTRHLDVNSSNDPDKVLYAQLRKQTPREMSRSQQIPHGPGDNPRRSERTAAQDQNIFRSSTPPGPASVYSELSLLENRCKSLPLMDNTSNGENHYRLSVPPLTPPRLSPKPVRQAACPVPRSEKTDSCNMLGSEDYMTDNGVYHLVGLPGSPHTASAEHNSWATEQQSDSVYAEVTGEVIFNHISQHPQPNSNTYELLEDVRPKTVKSDKWKWLFPEAKRKW